MTTPEVKYGLQVLEDKERNPHTDEEYISNAYRITTDDTGVWIDFVASFVDKEVAHAFIRSWNGEETPT